MEENITDQVYWEKYYKENKTVNKETIISVCSVYDQYFDLFFKTAESHEKIIEIGGYPGRYLAYFGYKYKIKPVSFDFNPDIEKPKVAFDAMGVSEYEILNGDFTKFKPEEQYDLVFSNGFIEHFNNYDEILDKHVAILKSGGAVMVMIPNKRYLRHIYGLLLDRNNLKMHNLKCMKKKVFLDFVERNDLELVSLNYFGGFPFMVHQKLNAIQDLVYNVCRRFFKMINPYLSKHPNKFTSSVLICIAKKK